jgi:hypothetical protein
MKIRIQDSSKFIDVDVAHPYLLGDVNVYERDVDKGQLNKNIGSMRKNGYDINDFKGN